MLPSTTATAGARSTRSLLPRNYRAFRSIILLVPFFALAQETTATLDLVMRSRAETPEGRLDFTYKTVHWDPAKTAVVVCDMWNTLRADVVAARVGEMAPRMNEVLKEARARGVTIVHAPSGCMDYYADRPLRKRCLDAPNVETAVPLQWNNLNPDREPPLPIDDSDGGWEGNVAEGTRPQTHQHDAIEIAEADAIGEGAEIYPYLEQQGIENVILMGVHTSMCVLGRPFGIRQLVYLGKNVALMRDMTDGLYNPEMPPKVSHVRGTELIVEHIEQYWCPTFTSTDLLNEPAFRFAEDKRPHVSFIVSDDHYDADKTLPRFAQRLREGHGMYCTVLHGQGEPDIPGTAELQTTDVVVILVRRLGLPAEQIAALRDYVKRGGAVIGLRTASHAFKMNYKNPPDFQVPEGRAEWPEFDAEILGGNYHNHGPNDLGTDVQIVPEMKSHPVLANLPPDAWHSTGSLYFTSPVVGDAMVLMTGSIPDQTEPLTWVREYGGGRILYSGLGHPDDFGRTEFITMLTNAIYWAMDQPVSSAR